MHPAVKNIAISLIISNITFGLIYLVREQASHLPVGVITFALIFAAVMAACMFGAAGGGIAAASHPAASHKETGVVKWFNVKKGYGFVTRESGEDIFLHYKQITGKGKRTVTEGHRVKFIVSMGDKGPQADEVEIL